MTKTKGGAKRAKPNNELRQRIRMVAEADWLKVRNHMKFGFELETQATNGIGYRAFNESRVDTDRMFRDLPRMLQEQLLKIEDLEKRTKILKYVLGIDAKVAKQLEPFFIEENWVLTRIAAQIKGDGYRMGEAIGAARSRLNAFNGIDLPADVHWSTANAIPVALLKAAKIQVGEDQSVRGFEFRTEGPLSYYEFQKAAAAVFKMDHTVDTVCSFHIHVSVDGVTHTFGPNLVRHMTEYLLQNKGRMPESVRARIKDSPRSDFFKVQLKNEKKSFVHLNPRSKAWEFRLFGNLRTIKDAMACVRLASEALQYAYRMKLNRQVSPTQAAWIEDDQWPTLMDRARKGELKDKKGVEIPVLDYVESNQHLRVG